MTGEQAQVAIAKVLELKKIREALWSATEGMNRLRARELNAANDHISLVINDIEADL